MMKFLKKEHLTRFLDAASGKMTVYVPVDSGKTTDYKAYKPGVPVSKKLKTTRSAKDFFFPQTESLVEFKVNGKNIEIIDPRKEREDFAVFGVRACDVRSFAILDKVYLTDPVDTYYKNRRDHGLIISMACARPAETCFCNAFGIDAADPEGDVVFTEIETGYAVEAKTEKGEAFLDSVADVFENAEDNIADESRAKIREIMAKLPLGNLDKTTFGGGKTEELFNRPEWESLSEACIACGTCTFVCPTCQCYDTKDYDTGHGVKRFRCWDSCMYSDFTKMAHGNPRLTQKERFRQRFMHKLVYFPENNDGEFGCVGCGRCLVSCPISMNIVKVMKKLTEGENND